MGLIQTGTIWIYRNETVASGLSPVTTPWRNAETFNGGQFFVQYGGSANLTLSLELSPIEANGLEADANGVALDPDNAHEAVSVLASGAHGSEGFCKPESPSIMDDPWKSWRLVITFDAEMTNCYLAALYNALAGG
jgi:hypothetical protein